MYVNDMYNSFVILLFQVTREVLPEKVFLTSCVSYSDFFLCFKNVSYIALILSVILWFKLTISWTKEAHHTKSSSVQSVRGTKNTIANPAHAISVSGVKVNHIKTSETTDHYIVPHRKDNEQHPNTRVLCETSEASL